MNRKTKRLLLVALSTLCVYLSGCTNRVSEQRVDKVDSASPRTIALLAVPEPEMYQLNVNEEDIPNFGVTLPGRIVALALEGAADVSAAAQRSYHITEIMESQGFKLSKRLTADLKTELQALGYRVIVVTPEINRYGGDIRDNVYLGDYPKVSEPVDFFLHVNSEFVGYQGSLEGVEPVFIPTLSVKMHLVSLSGREHKTPSGKIYNGKELKVSWLGYDDSPKLLGAAQLQYGGLAAVQNKNNIPADPKLILRGDTALDNEEKIATGLVIASQKVAKLVANKMK